MKRSIVLSLMLVFAVFMASETNAQKTKKKTSSSTTKKSTTKKTKKGSKPTKEPVVEVPVATPEPVADVPPEDTGVSTPDIVADSEAFNFNDITLDTTKPKDGYLKMAHLKGAKPFPLPENNKNSVNFYKRIWREINVADSENRIFSIPGETLIQFVMDGIKAGKVYAYADDAFTKKLTYAAVMKKFKDSVIVPLI
ncbi:MAG: hypothetical protein H7257_04725, partial [Taibaiella sp.]|nr:hypothetical protein [Taibaiella sp.]